MTHTCPKCGYSMIEHPLTPQQVSELRYMRNASKPLFIGLLEREERNEPRDVNCQPFWNLLDQGYVVPIPRKGYVPTTKALDLLKALKQ